jgi:hypothetical protein
MTDHLGMKQYKVSDGLVRVVDGEVQWYLMIDTSGTMQWHLTPD